MNQLKKLLNKAFRYVTGDWWTIKYAQSKLDAGWGVYHPWRQHKWQYCLTKEDAQEQCRKLNHDY